MDRGLIDTHCHLASHRYRDEEVPDLVARAREACVDRMITIGTDLEDSRRNIEIAENHPEVFATAGIHPTSVPDLKSGTWLEEIRGMLEDEKVVALGEIGMDFYHPAPEPLSEEDYRERQRSAFVAQLNLAVEIGIGVVIHQRNSHDAIMEIMEPYHGKVQAVFHCFSGDWSQARQLLDFGHLVSFTGVVTYKNAAEVQEAARQVPLEKFMVETDAPYLTPVPDRGKRCEPAHTRRTAAFIAELRGTSIEELAEATTRTACDFFRLPGKYLNSAAELGGDCVKIRLELE